MLWLDGSGRLLVTDSLNFQATQILDLNGQFIAKFGRAGDTSGVSRGRERRGHGPARPRLFVDAVLHGVQVFDTGGQLLLAIGALGNDPGEFRLPVGIFIGKDDTIYIADSYNRRVQVFRYVGPSCRRLSLFRLIAAGLLVIAAPWGGPAQAVLATTKHNLSVSGPGTVKATTEAQTCVFCHTPHNASAAGALWNRRTPTNTYTPYTSRTNHSVVGQPNGSSLQCLSCHDGTIALGELLSRGASEIVVMAGGVTTMPAGVNNVGLNLADDHPVSFVYNAALAASDGELASPATLTGKVGLDSAGRMQCATCHNPHNNDNGKFLAIANTASALCIVCHTKTNWAASDHADQDQCVFGHQHHIQRHDLWHAVDAHQRHHRAGQRLRELPPPPHRAGGQTHPQFRQGRRQLPGLPQRHGDEPGRQAISRASTPKRRRTPWRPWA